MTTRTRRASTPAHQPSGCAQNGTHRGDVTCGWHSPSRCWPSRPLEERKKKTLLCDSTRPLKHATHFAESWRKRCPTFVHSTLRPSVKPQQSVTNSHAPERLHDVVAAPFDLMNFAKKVVYSSLCLCARSTTAPRNPRSYLGVRTHCCAITESGRHMPSSTFTAHKTVLLTQLEVAIFPSAIPGMLITVSDVDVDIGSRLLFSHYPGHSRPWPAAAPIERLECVAVATRLQQWCCAPP